MRRDIPPTGNPLLDSMIKLGVRLVQQVERAIFPPPPAPRPPANMTDEELHSAIYNIGAVLLNRLGPVVQASFARYGYDLNNRRFKHPITITVRGHVLTMSTDANDTYGLAMNAIESYRRVGQTYNRVAPNSANSRLAAACDRMKRELLALAAEDGVTVAPNPGSLSKLAEQYLFDLAGT